MSKETKEASECCNTKSCCGFEKSSLAKFLRHIAEFFEPNKK